MITGHAAHTLFMEGHGGLWWVYTHYLVEFGGTVGLGFFLTVNNFDHWSSHLLGKLNLEYFEKKDT